MRCDIDLNPLPNQSTTLHRRLYSHLRCHSPLSTTTPLLHFKPLNTNPWLRELLSQHNGPHLCKVNRTVQHNRDRADNTRPCRFRFPIFTNNSAQATKSERLIPFPIMDRLAQGPSINMISICALGKGESEQGGPSPFVIEYVPAEATVGFAGIGTSPTPFVIDIPAREPYSDDKVPWTYEGDKGKAPAVEVEVIPGIPPTPPKKVTEEEAEAFMKIIKSKTAVRAFDGSRREVNGEIDLLIDVGPCSFSVTFQVLDIPNAFSLLLGRPWIHSAGAVPPSLHQKLKFIIEEKLIMVKGEEDYAIYKEMAVPYISVGNDENLPFHSFDTISVIRDYGKVCPTRADRMIGKILMRHNYILGTDLGVYGQGISRPIEVEEYKHRRGLGIHPSCHEIIQARRGHHLCHLAAHYGKVNRVSWFPHFPISFSDHRTSSGTPLTALPRIPPTHLTLCQPCMPSPRRFFQGLHSNPNLRHVDSNPFEECLEEPGPIYFGEGLDEDSQVPEIEESLRRLEDRRLTSVEPTEEINGGTEDEPRTLKIGAGLDPTQRTRMIDFLTRYQ
ncbi:hypothetical protein CRG98_034322 [Punica granatum]|uniref:G-patch domain-containing protein n=1 Tax=Punica granatum TaxID=22663 RepID=A0A2I0INL3_PUNGR|nr:hypothetical protein CRG98_034322 [Punica granatum]